MSVSILLLVGLPFDMKPDNMLCWNACVLVVLVVVFRGVLLLT